MWDDGAMAGGQAASFEVVLNGEGRRMEAGSTVLDLLAALGRDPRTVAVERNGDLLPRRDYGATRLAAGDRLEVVHFVQGGCGSGRSVAGIYLVDWERGRSCQPAASSSKIQVAWAASSTGRAADS